MAAQAFLVQSAPASAKNDWGAWELPHKPGTAAVLERIQIQDALGAELGDWSGGAEAEERANRWLRAESHRREGRNLALTVRAWYSSLGRLTPPSDWVHAEVHVEIPAHRAPGVRDVVAAGLLQHALKCPRVQDGEVAWHQAEALLGYELVSRPDLRFAMRCLEPANSKANSNVADRRLPAAEESPSDLNPGQWPISAVAVTGLPGRWHAARSKTSRGDEELAKQFVQQLRQGVPVGLRRALRIDITLPEARTYSFPLTAQGARRFPEPRSLAALYAHRRSRNRILTSRHRHVESYLARALEGWAPRPYADTSEVGDEATPCKCTRTVGLRMASVAKYAVTVLEPHTPLVGQPGWTGLCPFVETALEDVDGIVPWRIGEPAPGLALPSRDAFWAAVRAQVPDVGPMDRGRRTP